MATVGEKGCDDAYFSLLYLSPGMHKTSRGICIVFVWEQLCNKLKKVTEEQQEELPADLKTPRQSVEKVRQPEQPTAGDNIVSNYFHPYWAEDLTVVCFSVVSGPAAHLIPGLHQLCQASVRKGRH